MYAPWDSYGGYERSILVLMVVNEPRIRTPSRLPFSVLSARNTGRQHLHVFKLQLALCFLWCRDELNTFGLEGLYDFRDLDVCFPFVSR